ncbi:MAG: response regulator transcription factor [Chitinophagaceae bacterium]|nr:MAG: response regulator transcription factor [Chitinophagaceae bacterium]
MPAKIRVVIVDDHQVIRTSWKILFGTDDRFDVIAVFKSGQEAIEEVPALSPDVVLMDINMFPLNGFDTTSQLLQINPATRVIGISANNYPGYAQKIMAIGARGFVTKSSPFDELTSAVCLVNDGETYICQEISRHLGN